ncbi:MAG: glycosyltransferase [Desulfobulbaceae bacterium]|nr:glycosyltransferase [Desulfobulbaceae bacterium]
MTASQDSIKQPGGATPAEVEITMLVTCYNEAEFIVRTLETVTGALSDSGRTFEVIVIDDLSTDDSVAVIRDYLSSHPELPIFLHVNAKNQGVGNNFIDGAFLGRGEYYRVNDGDCPESRETLLALFELIGKTDLIIPTMVNNRLGAGRSFLRVFLSKSFVALVNILSGYSIRYYNLSPIFKRYHVMRWPSFTAGLGYQADLVTRILDQGVTYVQVPVEAVERKGPSSTALTLANLLSASHTLLEIALRRLKRIVARMAYGLEAMPPRGRELSLLGGKTVAKDDGR